MIPDVLYSSIQIEVKFFFFKLIYFSLHFSVNKEAAARSLYPLFSVF